MSDWFRSKGLVAARAISDQLKTIKDDIIGPPDALDDGSAMSLYIKDLQKTIQLLQKRCRELEASSFNGHFTVENQKLEVTWDIDEVQAGIRDSVATLDECIEEIDRDYRNLLKSDKANKDQIRELRVELEVSELRHNEELKRLHTIKDDLRNHEIDRLRDQFAQSIAHMQSEISHKDERINYLEKRLLDQAADASRRNVCSEKALIEMYAVLDEFQREKEKMFKRLTDERETSRVQYMDELENLRSQKEESDQQNRELKNRLECSEANIFDLNKALMKQTNLCEELRNETGALHATLRNLSPATGNRIEKYLIKQMLISYWKADERVRYQALRPILSVLEFEEGEMEAVFNDSLRSESIGQMLIKYVDQEPNNR
ncbi:hypothetical protein ACOME3_004357 [Neoechinorhynchus agilis]